MPADYSNATLAQLTARFDAANLHRPIQPAPYRPGTELNYRITGVAPARPANVSLTIEKFGGGGFSGQVYQIRIRSVDAHAGPVDNLQVGQLYALKILIPPSRFSATFRNLIYAIGFQAPFQLQVNPTAARAGALWQKFIRRAAALRFGRDDAVTDIIATLVDNNLGSCGEISEWIDGRTWRLETDNRLDLLKKWRRGKPVDNSQLGSPEYRAKHRFMHEMVKLLHELGAPEFARQYEWSTCKSQPNCLKRYDSADDPAAGLVAVDFRAGLALLPFLPMSPGDFKLIGKGLLRGSLVQFDRGDLTKLKRFIDAHPDQFADLLPAFEQLQEADRVYRDSIPDLTHNHIRLLYSRRLWSTMFDSAVTGWQTRNLADEPTIQKLRRSRLATLAFFVIGLIPILGRFFRRLWARPDYRRHYAAMLSSAAYLRRVFTGRAAESLIRWHRAGRINEHRALNLADHPLRVYAQVPLSLLPAGLHRFLTDPAFARAKLAYIFVRPIRLYFNAALREQWLRDMVTEGKNNHLLTDADAETIGNQINEPFIQKYLKSLAVHVCTLPVTQVVSVICAAVYYFTHPDDPNAWAVGLGIIGLFQVTPISPGSLCRGLYVVYLVVRERNFKDYNIAVFLGFFKYVGYLAFPIQMTYRYPVLARFMAAHWATGAVHVVPVFGEKGALLEHSVFALFYNLPLTLRRRMARRADLRATLPPRRWHLAPILIAAAAGLLATDLYYQAAGLPLPTLLTIWPLTGLAPILTGVAATLFAGGASLTRRIIQAVAAGATLGLTYTTTHTVLALENSAITTGAIATWLIWRLFLFAIFAAVGTITTELLLPEPPDQRLTLPLPCP